MFSSAGESGVYEYDVFISYSTRDKHWVRGDLLRELERAELRVAIDFRDFRPGAPSLTEIERLAEVSKCTLLVMIPIQRPSFGGGVVRNPRAFRSGEDVKPAYMESGWTEFETILLQTFDPANKNLRMIPLRKAECNIPERLKIFTYVDFAEPDDVEFAWRRRLTALGKPPKAISTETDAPQNWWLVHPYGAPGKFTKSLLISTIALVPPFWGLWLRFHPF